jgi:hypothetical protein
MTNALTIPSRFCGPSGTGNGGIAAAEAAGMAAAS